MREGQPNAPATPRSRIVGPQVSDSDTGPTGTRRRPSPSSHRCRERARPRPRPGYPVAAPRSTTCAAHRRCWRPGMSNSNPRKRAQLYRPQAAGQTRLHVRAVGEILMRPKRDAARASSRRCPQAKTTRNRLLVITQRFATYRTRLPILVAPDPRAAHRRPRRRLRAVLRQSGVPSPRERASSCGLALSAASTRWLGRRDERRQRLVTTSCSGAAARCAPGPLRCPADQQGLCGVMVLGSFRAWKDLLTRHPCGLLRPPPSCRG